MSKKPLAYISVEGSRISRAHDALWRISQALAKKGVRVYAANSAHHDVGFFIPQDKAGIARAAIAQEAPRLKCVKDVSVVRGIGMITVRGERIHDGPHALERISRILGNDGVSALTIVAGVDSIRFFFEHAKLGRAFKVLEKNISAFSDIA